jgi:hypothetical protein
MRPGRFESLILLAIPALALSSGCYAPKSERLSCDDIYAPEDSGFEGLAALTSGPPKGCGGDECHSKERQQQGLRLDDPQLVFEEFSTRTEQIYEVLSSGQMPEEGTAWSDDDLKLFRSWYCNGAFPP